MPSFITSTRGTFRTALAAGAVALTVAGASLTTAAPAEAFVRHGGGFHGGGFHGGGFHGGGFRHGAFGGFHRGGFGRARLGGFHRFGYGFRRGIVGCRPFGFGIRRLAYGIGLPYDGYGFRRCAIGRHFVPGLGCRLNAVYRYGTFGSGYRHHGFGVRRILRPAFGFGYGQSFGGYGHGFRHAGFGGIHRGGYRHGGLGGLHHAGFGPGGGGFRHGGHVRRR